MAAVSERRFTLSNRSLEAVFGAIDQSYGRHQDAADRMADAVAGFEDLEANVFANQCRILEARSRFELGDEGEALGLLQTAEAFFAPIGGRHFLDAIEAVRSAAAA